MQLVFRARMSAVSPAEPSSTEVPRPERAGCVKITLMLLGGGVVLAFIAGVTAWLILQTRMNPEQSGDAVGSRPVGPVAIRPVPTSVPPGTESVVPLPRDRMLVSTAEKRGLNTCGNTGPSLDVNVMDVTGGPLLPISDDPTRAAAVNSGDEEIWARLSPDRRRFVFYRSPVGKWGEHCRYFDQELWIANVDGTGVRRVFSNEQKRALAVEQGWPPDDAVQGHADWSPDGRHVVMFAGHVPVFGPLPVVTDGEIQLFTLDVDAGDLRQVTRRRNTEGRGLSIDPSYTPDGSTILFVGCPDRHPVCKVPQILSVPADSVNATRTTTVLASTDKGPNDVYVSPDGRTIAWIEVGILRINLFAAPYQAGKEVRLEDRVLVDAHGGYANWTADSGNLIYNRVWITDNSPLFSNGFDRFRSRRITSGPTSRVYVLPSP